MTEPVIAAVADVACVPGVILGCVGVWIVGDWRKAGWTVGLVANLCLAGYGWANLWTSGVRSWPALQHLLTDTWNQSGLRVIAHLAFAFVPLVTGAAQVRHLIRYRHETWRRLTPAGKANPMPAEPAPAPEPVMVPVQARFVGVSRPVTRLPHYTVTHHARGRH